MTATPPPSVTAAWAGGDATPRAHCVLAPNPGPMTLDGTNTWVLLEPGSTQAVVIDPGPLDEGHLAAVLSVVEERGARVPSRVIGPGLGASTQCARGVASPPAHGAVTDGGGVAVTCPSMPRRCASRDMPSDAAAVCVW